MDKRSEDKVREHSGDGHQLKMFMEWGLSMRRFTNGLGERRYDCDCGWHGWLDMEVGNG